MFEKFQNVMVSCAAITVFAGGLGAVINGASSLIDLKIDSTLVKRETAKAAAISAAEDAGMVGTIVKGAKKLLN